MSRDRVEKLEKKSVSQIVKERATPPGTPEIAGYVTDSLKGIRRLTKRTGRKDIAFLDYLLALAEQEADSLASNVYH
jgi:hypothetical protein